jgi:LPPG:FO 2-phospho-L-lactate transferase
VATQVVLADDASLDGRVVYRAGETISFQEYFVRLRHAVAVRSVEFVGAATARANGLAALQYAERIVIAPSNPLVSIAPIRALRGVDEILTARRDDVVAVSPIIGGAAVKGPADRMLRELGHEATALGVARIYAEVCGTFVIDTVDAALAQDIEQLGMRCVVTNTIMNNDDAARHLAQVTLSAAAATTVKTTVGTARTATRRGGS